MAIMSFLGIFVVYVLRVIISVAVVPMQKEFGWSDTEKGAVLSAFFIGYIVLQIPGGWMARRYGGKLVFGFGVLWPAIITGLTPFAASSIPGLMVMRALTGLGESVTYPSLHALLGMYVSCG